LLAEQTNIDARNPAELPKLRVAGQDISFALKMLFTQKPSLSWRNAKADRDNNTARPPTVASTTSVAVLT
jgi:hypothetical protein